MDEEEAWRKLQEAGWESEEREGETIWRNPEDGNWYEERRAMQILFGGEDVGSTD